MTHAHLHPKMTRLVPVLLLVDDEPVVIASMSRLLTAMYRVRVANSGERALAVASSAPKPDLILLDVSMRGLDGYRTLERLQNQASTADIPVIFVTAADDSADEERGFALGAVDYVTKPIRPTILLARIRTHLQLREAQAVLRDRNAHLSAEVDRQMAEAKVVQTVSIRALAHLAETRDPETGDHILRTQSYVQTLATDLRNVGHAPATLTRDYVALVSKSAPLHDIGKVGIPDNILQKPGKLTADEWTVMKTHAALGAQAIERAERDVAQPVAFLGLAKEIARWHHERWDGTGYPDGLFGEVIPLSARLMALADVFDALTTPRVYKRAMPFEQARDIILSERGRHFDPAIVDGFERCLPEFRAITARYQSSSAVESPSD